MLLPGLCPWEHPHPVWGSRRGVEAWQTARPESQSVRSGSSSIMYVPQSRPARMAGSCASVCTCSHAGFVSGLLSAVTCTLVWGPSVRDTLPLRNCWLGSKEHRETPPRRKQEFLGHRTGGGGPISSGLHYNPAGRKWSLNGCLSAWRTQRPLCGMVNNAPALVALMDSSVLWHSTSHRADRQTDMTCSLPCIWFLKGAGWFMGVPVVWIHGKNRNGGASCFKPGWRATSPSRLPPPPSAHMPILPVQPAHMPRHVLPKSKCGSRDAGAKCMA